MQKVFVNIGLSLDGYLAPEGMTMADRAHELGRQVGRDDGLDPEPAVLPRAPAQARPGGETGLVNDPVRATAERIGANVVGQADVDQGEQACRGGAVHTPVQADAPAAEA